MARTAPERTKHLHVLVNDEDLTKLDELAASDGVDRSTGLRLLIHQQHARLFGRKNTRAPSAAR